MTTLADRIARARAAPWPRAGKIPWDDPAFSARMLREHLAQEHDRASRRAGRIERQVAWIHDALLGGRPSRVLDLGCGPGLHTTRLARRGHDCVGIDFAPAAIAHARAVAAREGLRCVHHQRDLREGGLGEGFDAALLLFGELHTFSREEAARLLDAVRRALRHGGLLVLEVHPEAFVRALGRRAPRWFRARRGPFSDAPHLGLHEARWDAAAQRAQERWIVADPATGEVVTYVSTTRAYGEQALATLLRDRGFGAPEPHPSLEGPDAEPDRDFVVRVARAGDAPAVGDGTREGSRPY
ncbi:MAG: class I SAM-dependent methyltransferase [Myxococcota bacterium]|nr:class I SAM-dependent methyltransferase [Myxococcota bacterium]